MQKKVPKNGKWVRTNEYHDRGTDLSEIGLRGNLKPSDFGWDIHEVPESEKEGFKQRQQMLVDHYTWFRNLNKSKEWLRS